MHYPIWYRLYNLPMGSVTFSKLQAAFLHGSFSRFLNYINDTKLRKASLMYLKFFSILLHQQFNRKLTFLINHLKNIFFQRLQLFLHAAPTAKDENDTIISFLKSNRSACPNSIPIKIFKLTQNKIPKHLADTFNLSFNTDVFHDFLKITKKASIQNNNNK